ncbi:MAG: hypothetical protein GXO26_03380 [Crenarchaeota archaeon]|nr:hypothetical protein [Thermoproteota archaeon]
MTFVIDYDQLVPIMFFIGLGIGYILRKVTKKKSAVIARAILFLLIFIIIFLTSSRMFLIGLSGIALASALAVTLSHKERDRYLAYMGTIGLTLSAIALSMLICGLYSEVQLLILRVLIIGMLYISLILTLPVTSLTYMIRMFFGNSLTMMFLTTFLIFRKVINIIDEFRTSMKVHESYIRGTINKVKFSIDVLKRRVVPLLERAVDDITAALSSRGIDITGYGVKIPLNLKFTFDDVMLLLSMLSGVVVLALLCHIL